MRRCGKRSKPFQLLNKKYPNALSMNFEFFRLYRSEHKDFARLNDVIKSYEEKRRVESDTVPIFAVIFTIDAPATDCPPLPLMRPLNICWENNEGLKNN
jgi:hypothetical protein